MSVILSTIAAPPRVDVKAHGRLLAKFAPKVIETEEENATALAIVERLMEKGEDDLTREETALFALLTSLIERFEETAYPRSISKEQAKRLGKRFRLSPAVFI